MSLLLDMLAAGFLLLGVVLTVLAGLGLVRFPDVLSRMHAQSKPAVLGLILILAGTACAVRSWALIAPLLLVAMFQMLTAPVGSHMLGRAAKRSRSVTGDPRSEQ